MSERKTIKMTEGNPFYTILMFAIPMILSNLFQQFYNVIDTLIVGNRLGKESLAAVGSSSSIIAVFVQLSTGLALGGSIVISQYFGAGKNEKIRQCATTSAIFSGVVGFVSMLLILLFAEPLLLFVNTPEEIVSMGVDYLRFYFLGSVPIFVYNAFSSVYNALGNSRTPLKFLIISSIVNIVLDLVFIIAFHWGVAGAAIGTLVARILECVVLITYIVRKERTLNLRLVDYLHFNKEYVKDYLKVTSPMLLVQGLWGLNTALQTVILGHMTAAAIAANSAASNLFLMIKSMAVGAASTASVIIGKTIGTGDMEKVRLYSKTLQKMFVMIGVVGGILLFFLRIPILSLYELSENTREMANTFLMILSVVFVGMSYQMPTNNGIIRGGGSATFVMKMDLISIWGIVLPFSFIMAFVVKASPIVVLCCLNADQIFKCVPAFIKANYGNWAKKLTRD